VIAVQAAEGRAGSVSGGTLPIRARGTVWQLARPHDT